MKVTNSTENCRAGVTNREIFKLFAQFILFFAYFSFVGNLNIFTLMASIDSGISPDPTRWFSPPGVGPRGSGSANELYTKGLGHDWPRHVLVSNSELDRIQLQVKKNGKWCLSEGVTIPLLRPTTLTPKQFSLLNAYTTYGKILRLKNLDFNCSSSIPVLFFQNKRSCDSIMFDAFLAYMLIVRVTFQGEWAEFSLIRPAFLFSVRESNHPSVAEVSGVFVQEYRSCQAQPLAL